jgi:signal transduction histidine kinase
VIVKLETIADAGRSHGRIMISDNGQGFCLSRHEAENGNSKAHRGLTNMSRRAARCGARLELTSDGTGTRVQLDLPARFPAEDTAV